MSKRQTPVIEADAITKAYGSGDNAIQVLRGVDLEVYPGQIASIKGASGSGKSTLLNVLAGLDTADAGDVKWGGKTISPQKFDKQALAKRRSGFCGFVFQSYYLVPELSALENVLLAKRIQGYVTREDRDRAHSLMSKLGVEHRQYGLPNQLSGGERQRVAIARALINAPQLIIADEPTGNLDERTGDEVIELLLSVCRELGTACLLVTHSVEYASRADTRKTLSLGLLESDAIE